MSLSRQLNQLPHSPACERNQEPIGQVLAEVLPAAGTVLEIGSGTGQHAVYFAAMFPHLRWQASDCDAAGTGSYLPGLRQRLALADAALPAPLELDVRRAEQWPAGPYAAVFSANTAHIMNWPMVCAMLSGVGRVLAAGGPFALYGPFRYGDEHTAPSNAEFDTQLRRRDPAMGIRDALQVQKQASISGLVLQQDIAMPANNRLLIFHREPL